MTAAYLLPGDIILWDGCPALVEATVASNAPGYVKVKLHCSPVMFLWQGEMEVLHVGNIQSSNFNLEFAIFFATSALTAPHPDPVLLPAVWGDIAA